MPEHWAVELSSTGINSVVASSLSAYSVCVTPGWQAPLSERFYNSNACSNIQKNAAQYRKHVAQACIGRQDAFLKLCSPAEELRTCLLRIQGLIETRCLSTVL